MSINSYGTISDARHESEVYPGNDTLVLKTPLADVLTATTHFRREDHLVLDANVVLSDGDETPSTPIMTLGTGSTL